MGRVGINPKILKWAREDLGYTEDNIPNSIKNNYLKWESGEIQPTSKQLDELSRIYKRPSAFFFRKNPPKEDKIKFIEFRKSDNNNQYSPNINMALKEIINKRNIYIELLNDMGYDLINFSKNTTDINDIVDFSDYIRDLLNISLSEQKKGLYTKNNIKDYKHYNYLNTWKRLDK